MKYYKHMANMSHDTRLKRVRRKYGLEGYGLFALILEYISNQLDQKNPIPDLQETAEDIADEWGVDVRKVNEMMGFMVNQGLFEMDILSGRIVCPKMTEKYLDEYARKVPVFTTALEAWRVKQIEHFGAKSDNVGHSPDTVRTLSDNVPPEQNRREQNREELTAKAVSQMKDPTAAYIDGKFLERGEYVSWGKERKSVERIAAVCKKRPDPEGCFDEMLGKFDRLRDSGERFWSEQPVTPSAMLAVWDRIDAATTKADANDWMRDLP